MESEYQKLKRAARTGETPEGYRRVYSDLYKFMMMSGVGLSGFGAALAVTAVFPVAHTAVVAGISAAFALTAGVKLSMTVGEKILKNKRYGYRSDPNLRDTLKRGEWSGRWTHPRL